MKGTKQSQGIYHNYLPKKYQNKGKIKKLEKTFFGSCMCSGEKEISLGFLDALSSSLFMK